MNSEKINNEVIASELRAKIDAWSKDREHLSFEQQIGLADDIITSLYQRCIVLKIEVLQAQISETMTENTLNKLNTVKNDRTKP